MTGLLSIFGALSAFVAYKYVAEKVNTKRDVGFVGEPLKKKIPKLTKLFEYRGGQNDGVSPTPEQYAAGANYPKRV